MTVSLPTEKPGQIKFVYKIPENYSPQYINGVIGGVSPRGDITLNFFFENTILPRDEINVPKSDGSVDRLFPPQEMAKMSRDIKAGIILAPHVAENIMGFIKNLLDAMDTRAKQVEVEALKNPPESKEVEKGAQ